MRKLIKFGILFFLFTSCTNDSEQRKTIEGENVQHRLSLENITVIFPDSLPFKVKTSQEKDHFNSLRVKTISSLEGRDERGSFLYFIDHGYLPDGVIGNLTQFEGVNTFLKSFLAGSISNFNGKDLQFENLDIDGIQGMQVRGIVEGNNFKGIAKYRAFTDGHHLVLIGVAGQNFTDKDTAPFLFSFRIKE